MQDIPTHTSTGFVQGLSQTDHPIISLGIGVFDGFHLGHQALAQHCSHILSFYPHPRTVLANIDIPMIATIAERLHYFPNTLWIEFSRAFSAMDPDTFLNTVVFAECHPKRVVVGYDFRFGQAQTGTPAQLEAWGKQHGIDVQIISPKRVDRVPVKSSHIRRALAEGHLDLAMRLMGHPFLMIGTVVKGEGRGRTLGFPTANLSFPKEKLIPANGVYTAHVTVQQQRVDALVYVGNKPTFQSNHPVQVEVYLLDFEGDLYGQTLDVWFQKRIRGEMQFASSEALVRQIEKDLGQVRLGNFL